MRRLSDANDAEIKGIFIRVWRVNLWKCEQLVVLLCCGCFSVTSRGCQINALLFLYSQTKAEHSCLWLTVAWHVQLCCFLNDSHTHTPGPGQEEGEQCELLSAGSERSPVATCYWAVCVVVSAAVSAASDQLRVHHLLPCGRGAARCRAGYPQVRATVALSRENACKYRSTHTFSCLFSDPWLRPLSPPPAAAGWAVCPFVVSSRQQSVALRHVWSHDASGGEADELVRKAPWLGKISLGFVQTSHIIMFPIR